MEGERAEVRTSGTGCSRHRLKRFEIQQGEIALRRPPSRRVDMNHIAKPDGHGNGAMPDHQRTQARNALRFPLFEAAAGP